MVATNKGYFMFISTPFIRFTANHFYRKGKITEHQRETLIAQDMQINAVLTVAVAALAVAYIISL